MITHPGISNVIEAGSHGELVNVNALSGEIDAGNDRIDGQSSNDTISGRQDLDTMLSGFGDDTMNAGLDNTSLDGGKFVELTDAQSSGELI